MQTIAKSPADDQEDNTLFFPDVVGREPIKPEAEPAHT